MQYPNTAEPGAAQFPRQKRTKVPASWVSSPGQDGAQTLLGRKGQREERGHGRAAKSACFLHIHLLTG